MCCGDEDSNRACEAARACGIDLTFAYLTYLPYSLVTHGDGRNTRAHDKTILPLYYASIGVSPR